MESLYALVLLLGLVAASYKAGHNTGKTVSAKTVDYIINSTVIKTVHDLARSGVVELRPLPSGALSIWAGPKVYDEEIYKSANTTYLNTTTTGA